uniref:Major sperm protein n=1 Tax=Caenorhabditis tropicalis TaxID=1561998 RepID=A0A1I7TFL8_9PELO
MDFIREHVSRMIKEQTEQEEERKANETEKGEAPKLPEKRTRRKYTMTFTESAVDEDGNVIEKKVLMTARDLASIMPPDQGVIVVCNPEKSLCKIRVKKPKKEEEVVTVAKPRYNTPINTLVVTTEYNDPEDLEKIFREKSIVRNV